MIGHEFVRVGLSFEGYSPNYDDVIRIAEESYWGLQPLGQDRYSLVLEIRGTAKMSASNKAQTLVETKFRHIPGSRVEFAVLESYNREFRDTYDIFDQRQDRGYLEFGEKHWLTRPKGLIYQSPPERAVSVARNREFLRSRLERYGVSGQTEYIFRPKYGLWTEERIRQVEDRAADRMLLILLVAQIFFCGLCGSILASFSKDLTKSFWDISLVVIVVPLVARITVVTGRRLRGRATKSERTFFLGFPYAIGAVALLYTFLLAPDDTFQIPGIILTCLAYAGLSFGLFFMLEYEKIKLFALQFGAYSVAIIASMPLYAEYRIRAFLGIVGVDPEAVQFSRAAIFEVAAEPSVKLIVCALAFLGIIGWWLFFFGSAEPNWISVIIVALLFGSVSVLGLAHSIYSVGDDAQEFQTKSTGNERILSFNGVRFQKVCVLAKDPEAPVDFGFIRNDVPYWVTSTTDNQIWLIRWNIPKSGRSSSAVSVPRDSVELRSADIDETPCR